MEPSAFQLSRIYGQGWNAARQLLAEGPDDIHPKQAATLNPYNSAAERTRWSKGFEEGLLSRSSGRAMSNLRSLRRETGK